MTDVTEHEEGKRVIDANGNEIGIVSAVKGGRVYVEPDPALTDRIRSKLGWGDDGKTDYPLDESQIDAITDDEVRLRR